MVWPLLIGAVIAGGFWAAEKASKRRLASRLAEQEVLENAFKHSQTYNFQHKEWVGPFSEIMSTEEARLILNVDNKATVQDIKKAHRRLMKYNHPDTGGSTLITRKINEAKDLLAKDKL